MAGRDLDTPSGTGGVRWSQDALARLGLPDVVVQATLGLEPDDDLAWLDALARGVSSLCRTLPKGHAVVAGPRAHRLGAALDLPVVRRPDPPPYGGSICLQTGDSRPGREWLAHVRGDRWLHVVAGSRGWRDLALDEPPLAISWVDHAALPEALQLCARLGLVLGYGTAGGRWDRVFRAAPVDVAIALRSLLPRS